MNTTRSTMGQKFSYTIIRNGEQISSYNDVKLALSIRFAYILRETAPRICLTFLCSQSDNSNFELNSTYLVGIMETRVSYLHACYSIMRIQYQ